MDAPQPTQDERPPDPAPVDPRSPPVAGAVDRILDSEEHGRQLAEELAHLLGRG